MLRKSNHWILLGTESRKVLRSEAPCKNVLKIRQRKMNHHKHRKLVKRTRFLRQKIKFERDLRRIWLKAGLKEAPAGWQTPKIYLKGK
ncbi:unnamed protein product [Nyctereutes procyonoides]|uniref:Small ribosomal subunit protein mS38 n=1 Tax=Nyctereutes procyonoides TaxID=34880 RepID=A0A811Y1I8_NYCPR|nr:unnamed protein product [Nyctereutes procyonoides]